MTNSDLQRLIDRLVDDEMSAGERRQLLACLEAEPDGWRRCALAFLEAQGWRRSLAPLAGASVLAVPKPVNDPSQPHWGTWPPRIALAAALLAAFALGWGTAPGSRGERPRVASQEGGASPGASPRERPSIAGGLKNVSDTPIHAADGTAAPRRAGQVSPAAPTGVGTPNRAVTDRLRRQLERQGYAIREERGLTALVKLKDGRRVAVPVEQIKLHYVGKHSL